MKVALLTSDYLPAIGGIAAHVAELGQALVRLRHEVQVWCWDLQGTFDVKLPNMPTIVLAGPSRLRPRFLWNAPRLLRAIRSQPFAPDILHAHSHQVTGLLRLLGPQRRLRRIFTNHSSGYLKLVQTRWGQRKARWMYGGIDGLLAPSEELLERSQYLRLPAERCAYIPNGVDAERFQPGDRAAARAALGIPAERFVVLSTRRFTVKNGLRYLAQAMATVRRELPSALCVFCGSDYDGQELPAVQRIVAAEGLGQSVRFEGSVPNERIRLYLDAADLVALPSLMEATSISGLEAMACARPLVGTRVGGIPAIIADGETGLLVPPAEPEPLAAAILRIAREGSATAMGAAGRARVLQEFSWRAVATRTAAFYETILSRSPYRGWRASDPARPATA